MSFVYLCRSLAWHRQTSSWPSKAHHAIPSQAWRRRSPPPGNCSFSDFEIEIACYLVVIRLFWPKLMLPKWLIVPMSPIPLSAIGPCPVSFRSSVRTSKPNWKISPGQVVMDILTGNWGKVAVFVPEKGIYQLRGGDPKSSDLSNQVFIISPASQFRIRPVHLLLRPKVALVLMLLPGCRACLHATFMAVLLEHLGIWRVHLLKAYNFILN